MQVGVTLVHPDLFSSQTVYRPGSRSQNWYQPVKFVEVFLSMPLLLLREMVQPAMPSPVSWSIFQPSMQGRRVLVKF